MTEVLLIAAVIVIFVCGCFLMAKLDSFLDENRKSIQNDTEKKEPSYIVLTEDMSDEEALEEIHNFRSSHKCTHILIYDASHINADGLIKHQFGAKM